MVLTRHVALALTGKTMHCIYYLISGTFEALELEDLHVRNYSISSP